jgi:hypothetical protein
VSSVGPVKTDLERAYVTVHVSRNYTTTTVTARWIATSESDAMHAFSLFFEKLMKLNQNNQPDHFANKKPSATKATINHV